MCRRSESWPVLPDLNTTQQFPADLESAAITPESASSIRHPPAIHRSRASYLLRAALNLEDDCYTHVQHSCRDFAPGFLPAEGCKAEPNRPSPAPSEHGASLRKRSARWCSASHATLSCAWAIWNGRELQGEPTRTQHGKLRTICAKRNAPAERHSPEKNVGDGLQQSTPEPGTIPLPRWMRCCTS